MAAVRAEAGGAARLAVAAAADGLTGAVGAMAASVPLTPEAAADVAELRRRLDETLAAKPLPIDRARALAAAFQAYVDAATRPAQRKPGSTRPSASRPQRLRP